MSLFSRLCSSDRPDSIAATRPGLFEAVPDVSCTLVAPQPTVVSAFTGPDQGIVELKQKLQDLDIQWQHPDQYSLHQQQQAWGHAISLYDRDLSTGCRNGDPIADCYGVITYQNGAVLALADGVNWGERPRAAARAAVYGFLSHMHQQLAVKQGGRSLSSNAAFHIMQGAVKAAQEQVLAADGTLTTLVGVLVLPQRWGRRRACCSVVIGDSPSYVWRAAAAEVVEINHQPPVHGFHRDPRACPGCLGYAVGNDADLSNISYAITSLNKGDMVFLASDGISDNFDPVIRKQASGRGLGEGSSRVPGLNALSPSTCHKMALEDMAGVLKDACRAGTEGYAALVNSIKKQQQQQQQQLVVSLQEQQQQQQQEATAYVQQQLQQMEQQQQQQQQHHEPGPQAASPPLSNTRSSNTSPLPLEPVDGSKLTATAAVHALLAFVEQGTAQQRQLLEENSKTGSRGSDELGDLVANLPGKMDHASVVAYKVQ